MDKISRIRCIATAALLATGLAGPALADDDYPSKPIHLIVPYLAGGAADIVARVVANHLGEDLKQPVIVENRPGAGSNIGTALAAKAPADGYTLVIQGNTLGSNIHLYKDVGYDPIKSLDPVAFHYRDYNALIVHPSFPANSVKEVIEIAKKRPGELTFSSSGNGTSTHLSGELFNQMAGVKIVHVPYRGVPPAVADVMGGQVTMMFAGASVVSAYVRAGKLKALAVTGTKRLEQMPDVPPVADTLPGFDSTTWTGLFAPAGTPRPIIDKLHTHVTDILKRPSVRKGLEDRGLLVEYLTTSQMAELIRQEISRWGALIKATGAKVD